MFHEKGKKLKFNLKWNLKEENTILSNLNSKHIFKLFILWLSFAETMFLRKGIIVCLNTVD